MRIIGLTGSIACGKSTVSAELARLGVRVVDGDLISHELTGPGGAALPFLRQAFPAECFGPDGAVNRSALGRLVFSDPGELRRLDQIMAPLLREAIEGALNQAREEGCALCVLDLPLLYEKGYDSLCDTVWVVWTPESTQLNRLMARDGMTREEARARIRAVMSSDEKAARAQVVVDNSGALEETMEQVHAALARERAAAAPRRRRSQRYADASSSESTEARPVSSFPPAAPTARPFREEQTSMPGNPSAGSPVSPPSPPPGRTPREEQRPAPVFPSEEIPAVMERPQAARRRPSTRKAAWRMPAWLMGVLCGLCALLLIAFTAQCLMDAYLKRQEEQHIEEQQAIDRNYPLQYRDLIERYAAEYNLKPAFVAAIIRNESSFQPEAESPVGARGLMQLMPDTAEWIAGKLKVNGYAFDRMKDPASNIQFGCWYLRYLSNLFRGDPVCVICAYHAGQGEIASWLSNRSYSPDGNTLPLETLPEGPTKIYAGRVTRDYGIYQTKYFTPADSDADAVDASL